MKKKEIFLIVLEKEFTLWVDSFLKSNNQTSDISPDEFDLMLNDTEELKIAKTIDNSKYIFQVQRPLDQKLTSIIMKVKPKIFIINNLDESQKKQWNYLRNKYLKMFENKEYNRLKKISKLRI